MKRDMSLIRLILLEIEGEDPKLDLSSYTEEQQVYHGALLIEAGFVHGKAICDSSAELVSTVITRLNWEGHEFLETARNETIWKKVSSQIAAAGVTVGLPALQQLLAGYLKAHLDIK